MTVTVKDPSRLEIYVDKSGRLTLEGVKLIQEMARALREAQATIADHETRITALEP